MAWELAQLNIAAWAVDPEGVVAQEFHDQLDEVSALSDAAGAVWRPPDDTDDGTDVPTPWGDGWIANLSVWPDVETLRAFTYGGRHAQVMRDRRRWFAPSDDHTSVLWWVPAGHRPTLDEAAARLSRLREAGPTAVAFTLGEVFPPPG